MLLDGAAAVPKVQLPGSTREARRQLAQDTHCLVGSGGETVPEEDAVAWKTALAWKTAGEKVRERSLGSLKATGKDDLRLKQRKIGRDLAPAAGSLSLLGAGTRLVPSAWPGR